MARKLRFEFPGESDRVIHRGNYRFWDFQPAKTRADARDATKSADGKVAVAAWLKPQTDPRTLKKGTLKKGSGFTLHLDRWWRT